MKKIPWWVHLTRRLGVLVSAMAIVGFIVALLRGALPNEHLNTSKIINEFYLPCLVILPWRRIRNNFLWWPLFIMLSLSGLFLFFAGIPLVLYFAGKWRYLFIPFLVLDVMQIPAVWYLKFRYKSETENQDIP